MQISVLPAAAMGVAGLMAALGGVSTFGEVPWREPDTTVVRLPAPETGATRLPTLPDGGAPARRPVPTPEVEPRRPGPVPMPEVEPRRPGPVPMPEVEPRRPGPVPMPGRLARPGPRPGSRGAGSSTRTPGFAPLTRSRPTSAVAGGAVARSRRHTDTVKQRRASYAAPQPRARTCDLDGVDPDDLGSARGRSTVRRQGGRVDPRRAGRHRRGARVARPATVDRS